MPCRDSRDDECNQLNAEAATRLRGEVNKLTAFLCDALSLIEGAVSHGDSASDVLNRLMNIHPDLLKWWGDHKKMDELRHAAARARLPHLMQIAGDLSVDDLEKLMRDLSNLKR